MGAPDAEAVPSRDAGGKDATSAADAGAMAMTPTRVSAQVSGLLGTGLRLRAATGEELTVTSDGRFEFAQPLATMGGELLTVVQQPVEPSQTCSVRLDESGAADVRCEVARFALGGTVSGLSGEGLVLSTSWGENLALDANGAFVFAERIPDLTSYVVTVASSPTSPKQSCAIVRGEGRISARDVTDLSVDCSTHRFGFKGTVSGMLGSGLELELAGETLSVSKDGPFAFAQQLPDGASYAVRVKKQPVGPEQKCIVIDGESRLAGADVELAVVCGALGGLRVSELGSCHYANSACWLELYNAGSSTEELSYYQLRTQSAQRTAPFAVSESHTFDLPAAALAPGARAVIRARSTGSLPDGQGVVHIADGIDLPWWSGDGFVELLTGGRSVDFVRFGGSEVAPTVATAWKGGSAPLLPSGGEQYGHAIARDLQNTDTDSSADWTLRAFATPGGPNDVSSDADVDADGIPDVAEVSGGTFAGLNLYAMGARTGVKDLFVEIDRMDSREAVVTPRREALEKLVKVFAARGIAIHFDVGDLYAAQFNPAKFNLGGGNVVPFAKAMGFGENDEGIADLYAYKATHMAVARRAIFYYSIFAWSQNANGSGGSSGLGERPGNDTLITLGGWGLDTGTTFRTNLLINYQAATLMHELGHNLGLRHGGSDDINRKPNYVSVMNYLYSPLGLPTIGRAEGDRFDISQRCSIYSVALLTNPPTGSTDSFVLDFSDGYSGDLVESSLLEADGLGRVDSGDVDYNCNGREDGPYARDLNDDGRKDVLMDHDDWSSLQIVFRRSFSGNENGPWLFWRKVVESVPEDVLTDDVQPVSDEPCPVLSGV